MTTTTMKLTVPLEFVALRTVPVYLASRGRQVKVNALLDEGSSRSYLNSDVAAELGLEGRPQELTVKVLNDNQEKFNSCIVEFMINSMDGRVLKQASAYTTERVTGDMQVLNWNLYKTKWKHLERIKFPQVGPRPIVDLLIGVDQADLLYSLEDVRGRPGEPIARLTPLGWTCIGNPELQAIQAQTNFTFLANDSHELNNLVRRFWDVDDSKEIQIVKPEEKIARDVVAETLTFEDGHYSVGLPWKTKDHNLPDNFTMAMHRLQSTEKRLQKSPELAKAYSDILETYQDKGYIRKVLPEEEKPDQVWYLPHFPILRPDKSTTKVRVVFDASAKCEEVSLNDFLLQGPKLQNDLFTVLLRFRRDPIALMCDIKEMYLQIKLNPSDRPYHRFLWRNMETKEDPNVFEFERIVFGVSSSPFLAQFVIQEHARKHQSQFPLGAETILKSTYMDDSMDSVPDMETGIELYKQLSQLWASAGMHARKWLSNISEVLKHIPHTDCVTEVDLDRGELPVVKTLGVLWTPNEDEFKYQVHPPSRDHYSTKRAFLKGIATLFDPLGFLSPYVIRAKIILQEMWESGVDWDDLVEESLSRKAQEWFEELSELPRLCVPRCLRTGLPVKKITLHTFTDASQQAYGAATYSRHLYEDGSVTCRLVASKSKVAPLQAVSIPRLELMAAVVGLRLAEAIGNILNLPKHEWLFWSDSVDVLYWIRGCSRKFKPFVANRVGEIQSLTDPEQWRHVPTKQNPADLLTRGLSVSTLIDEKSWWKGPEFLMQEEIEWPEKKIGTKREVDIEVRKQYQEYSQECSFLSTVKEDRLDPTRYSSWTRLTRVSATVNRFLENCRLPSTLRKKEALGPEEIVTSEMHFIRLAQQEEFQEEIQALKSGKGLPGRSKLLPLKPVLDEEGVLRCDGRLKFADCLPWETRYPIILPRNHQITKLIIKDSHEKNQHGGTNQVLAHLSSRYWIVSAREAIREWEKECFMCRRRKVSPAKQVMAPLPELRTQKSLRAFSQTSIDFAGPFYTKQGRGKTRHKRYLCLFTCLGTRAVHLEVAYGLDTDSFLNAFFRMVSRRGLPKDVLSDNGTNFVGANNELEKLAGLDGEKIQEKTACYGIKWHFNPPLAPHFSGVHEVMIKAAKRAIYAILSSADVTDEEFLSAVVGAEGLINSRPLTYQSVNPQDPVPLTPNHFLHGQLGGRFAPDAVDSTVFNPRRRWRRVQELVRHFWHRWLREWLPSLNARKKWFREQENFQEGDVVIVMSPETPRGRWPLGRITKVYPGQDGKVRVVDVQVGKSVMRRPVVKLCPLEHCD